MPRAAKATPASNPIHGLVLSHLGYTITVTGRSGDAIEYTAVRPKMPARKGTQSLEDWLKWAPTAKVKVRPVLDTECVVIAFAAAGPCRVCKLYMDRNIHTTEEGLFCEDHCPKERHK